MPDERLMPMATYQELLQQREALDLQILAARETELAAALEKIKGIVEQFGLTAQDIFGSSRVAKAPKSPARVGDGKVAAKYRDPVTGAQWTGRGRAPKWIADKDRAKFLIV